LVRLDEWGQGLGARAPTTRSGATAALAPARSAWAACGSFGSCTCRYMRAPGGFHHW